MNKITQVILITILCYFTVVLFVRDRDVVALASKIVETMVAGWLGYLMHDVE